MLQFLPMSVSRAWAPRFNCTGPSAGLSIANFVQSFCIAAHRNRRLLGLKPSNEKKNEQTQVCCQLLRPCPTPNPRSESAHCHPAPRTPPILTPPSPALALQRPWPHHRHASSRRRPDRVGGGSRVALRLTESRKVAMATPYPLAQTPC